MHGIEYEGVCSVVRSGGLRWAGRRREGAAGCGRRKRGRGVRDVRKVEGVGVAGMSRSGSGMRYVSERKREEGGGLYGWGPKLQHNTTAGGAGAGVGVGAAHARTQEEANGRTGDGHGATGAT